MTRKSELTSGGSRGTLKLPTKFSCRFCPGKFENFDQLRFHAQTEHPIITRTVNRQLGQVDAKLRIFEKLAEEGMRGYHEAKGGPGAGISFDPERIEALVDHDEAA